MKARLYRVILPVTDIDESATAYRRLWRREGERVSPGRHYFDLGGVILALYDPLADGDEMGDGWRHHPHQYLYVAVDDLEATRERARAAGFQEVTTIEEMPWGERLFYARDPSGNPISFVDEETVFRGSAGATDPE